MEQGNQRNYQKNTPVIFVCWSTFISIENVKEKSSDEFLEKQKKRKDSLSHHALC
jgi:hypothetical protein